MTYSLRSGYRAPGELDPEKAAIELERLRVAGGGQLMPPAIVEAARNEISPLNGAITWNLKAAAYQHQLHEARLLVRAIIRTDEATGEQTCAFVHVAFTPRGEEGQENGITSLSYYQSAEVIPGHPDEYQAAIQQAQGRLNSAERSLQEMLGLARKRKDIRVIGRAVRNVGEAVTAIQTLLPLQ